MTFPGKFRVLCREFRVLTIATSSWQRRDGSVAKHSNSIEYTDSYLSN
jgi:hypothetical protein